LPPFLSVVIPAYDEESRLPGTLQAVFDFLDQQPYESEVIVVDNASRDRTSAVVRSFPARRIPLTLEQQPVRGKGAAVRQGMLRARGEYRFVCDADLSMPVTELPRFLPPARDRFDIAIASREVTGAQRYGEPALRHWIGRGFNTLVRWLAVPGFQDTQCGFKCFRGAVAEDLFHVQRLDGWTFDVEVLFLALRKGYRVVEVPIPWYYVPGSRVRVLTDSVAMFLDLVRIRANAAAGVYGRPT
jgi:glycosyltransferase involved in cell wall biosynthesis